jgi:hypothetical protein
MIPSSNHLLHAAVVTHFHEITGRFPPPHAPGFAPPTEPPYRIGEYLVYLGYLLPHELTAALHPKPAEPTLPLGCRLVLHNLVPAPVVATVLLLEWLDRYEHHPSFPARTPDEQLLVDAVLSADQVALVVAEQIQAYAQGTSISLDDLIMRHGWRAQALSMPMLEAQAN